MNTSINDFTFLTNEELFGDKQLDVLKKYGMIMSVTDFSILLGAFVSDDYYSSEGKDLKNRAGYYWSASSGGDGYVRAVDYDGSMDWLNPSMRTGAARPASTYSNLSLISPNVVRGANGVIEIEYGEFPQMAVSESQNRQLEDLYKRNSLKKTGNFYTTDSNKWDDYDVPFKAMKHEEFEYNGKRYIRVISKTGIHGNGDKKLSNGVLLNNIDNQPVWIEVQPIKRLVDEKTKKLVIKDGVFSGVRFNQRGAYDGNFINTEIKKFMDTYFSKEIVANASLSHTSEIQEGERKSRLQKLNPDTTNPAERRRMTDTEIIHSWIEAGQSVLLRGPSGIGKTERIKTLYPDLIYIKLTNNMFPEKVVGSMNLQTGQSIPPDFAKQALLACSTEEEKKLISENIQNIYDLADKIYERSKTSSSKVVIMLDELLNVKPAVQSLVYTLVLNRLVETGKGLKLPANTVIVATGNQKKYSTVAEDLAEPLEKRFDHILDMEPKVGEWINEYAIPNKVHPSVIGYIYSKYIQKNRSESISDMDYFYEEPEVGENHLDRNGCRGRTNDPRGWVSISNTLYAFEKDLASGKFVGKDVESTLQISIESKLREEWAREFYDFYNIPTLSVEEVVANNYTQADLPRDINERFAYTTSLLLADENQVATCRKFIRKHCDPEYLQLYDICWMGNDQKRMEKIVELQEMSLLTEDMNTSSKGVGRRV